MNNLPSIFKKQNLFPILLGIFTILGFSFRLYSAIKYDIWYDEAYSGLLMWENWPQMWQKLLQDVHPPLYYAVLKLWSGLFGANILSIRLFSVIISTISIPLLAFSLKKHNLTQNAVLSSTFLFSFSTFFVNYGAEARGYALLTLFAILSLYFFPKNTQEPSKNTLWFGLSLLGAALTHYTGFIWVGMIGLWHIYSLVQQKNWFFWQHETYWQWFAFAFGPFILGILFWIPTLLNHAQKSLGWIPQTSLLRLPETITIALTGNQHHMLGMQAMRGFSFDSSGKTTSIILFFAIITAFIWQYMQKTETNQEKNTQTLFLWLSFGSLVFVWFISVFLGIHIYVERYLIAFFVPILALLGIAWAYLPKYGKITSVLAYFLLIIGTNPHPTEPPYKEITAFVKENKQNIHKIYNDDPIDYSSLRFLLETKKTRIKLLDNPWAGWNTWAIINDNDLTQPEAAADASIIIESNVRNPEDIAPSRKNRAEMAKFDRFTIWGEKR